MMMFQTSQKNRIQSRMTKQSLANKPQSSNDDGAFMINEAISTPRNSGCRYDNSRVWPYEYNPVQTDWQRATCHALGLQIFRPSGTRFRAEVYLCMGRVGHRPTKHNQLIFNF